MGPQEIFYILGSVYLVMGILVFAAVLVAIIYGIKKMNEVHESVSRRVDREINEIKEKPRVLASYIGSVVAKTIKNKFTKDA